MKSIWRFLYVAVAVGVLLVGVGCSGGGEPEAPQADIPAPSAPPAPNEPTDVTPPPRPTVEDATPNPLDAEIKEADQHARDNGMIGDVYFDFDKYELKEEARQRLAKNADFLKGNGAFVVTIEGHCDERGTNDYNIALGDRRANAAKDYLISLGVSAGRVRTVSYGEERPSCTDSNEGCWFRNRRGEFHLSGRS
ncbi:MAG: peptidoglycan-associated lipoprotein Pal [Acidobacteriota bacterium]|nr:peptidoglycan-associated lipoprotein Pal [Acidobacteriota bacterium]